MTQLTFIDLFAGCGGLSLGLMQAGWNGVFAIEQNSDAFRTLNLNLIEDRSCKFNLANMAWPHWLPKQPLEIRSFLKEYGSHLSSLRGTIGLVAGGPPCQGFSSAGRRLQDDPRNRLYEPQLEVVKRVSPSFVLLENVRGISLSFQSSHSNRRYHEDSETKNFASDIKKELNTLGYVVEQDLVHASDFGVPQRRSRHITVGVKTHLASESSSQQNFFFKHLKDIRSSFLIDKNLPTERPVTVEEAISDLCVHQSKLIECTDPESREGFQQVVHRGPQTVYQRLMNRDMGGANPNSMRLVNHRYETTQRFISILNTCRKGKCLSKFDRDRLGIGKLSTTPLAPDAPSPTLTTLPDDLLHYAEPRVHTVREHARLQSFPDWYEFRGKYTTGGHRRARECPRYTQVGNAVPPLLAEAMGAVLKQLILASQSC